jgi:hypothetical protein
MELRITIGERSLMLLLAIITAVSVVGIVLAAVPNPGHSWAEVECSGCITSSNLAGSSVTGAKIQDGTITSDDISSIEGSKITMDCELVTCQGGDWVNCACPSGKIIQTGGCLASASPYYFQQSSPLDLSTWRCGGHGGAKTITMICCRHG